MRQPMVLIRIFPWFKSSIPETRIYRCASCSNFRYSTIALVLSVRSTVVVNFIQTP
jgi:virulence-associated protein VapD